MFRRFFIPFLLLFFVIGGLFPIFSVTHASTLLLVDNQPSSLVAGALANQKFTFTTRSSWEEGETLTITFPSAYSTGTIVEDDVDIIVNGAERTTATTCAGTEMISVTMSSNILTATVCAGDGGIVGTNATVNIEIGTNAASSGTGAHQLTNPADEGSYFIAIGGTFGDSGSVIMPITDGDNAGVTASVPESTGGTGGGGSGGGGRGGGTGNDGGDDTSDPSDPVLPDDPTTPEPTDPINPSEPTGPTDPEAPDDPDGPIGSPENPDNDTGPSAPSGSSGGSGDSTGGSEGEPSSDGGSAGGSGDTNGTGDGDSNGEEGGVDDDDPLSSGDMDADDDQDTAGGSSGSDEGSGDGVDAASDGFFGEDTFVARLADTVGAIAGVFVQPIATPLAPVVEAIGEVFGLEKETMNIISDTAAPTTSGVAIVSTTAAASAASAGQIGSLFHLFFTQPFLFFARRRKRHFGTVYNSVTKSPLELATVRAYSLADNRLAKTAVTDSRGEFMLVLPKPGLYRLVVVKSGFQFPSAYLGNVQEDGKYTQVYTGQKIEVRDGQDPIAVSIPLDPSGEVQTVRQLRGARFRRRLALALAPMSVIFAGISCLFSLSLLTLALFFFQLGLFLVTWKLVHRSRPASWGVVYDFGTRRPVGNVVIRLFESKYNKLVESVLSDGGGRYIFSIGPNEYYVTYSKGGYIDTTVRPIDYSAKKEPELFGVTVPLKRQNGSS